MVLSPMLDVPDVLDHPDVTAGVGLALHQSTNEHLRGCGIKAQSGVNDDVVLCGDCAGGLQLVDASVDASVDGGPDAIAVGGGEESCAVIAIPQ